jgi:glycosyltransferase involved in cell wall biosynthesis
MANSNMAAPGKLIYILNSYSAGEASHFHHVLGLLEALAARGIEIALIIERAHAVPQFESAKIAVYPIAPRSVFTRRLALQCLMHRLVRSGFTRSYVRIAAITALQATFAHTLHGGRAFLWQSGTTIDYDEAQPLSLKKLIWRVTSDWPNRLARRFVHCFVTGPQFMIDYYAQRADVRRVKMRLLFNDIDIRRFDQPQARCGARAALASRLGIPPDSIILLMVHRLSPVRRTLLYMPGCLIHAQAQGLLGGVHTVIAGGGPELPEMQQQVRAAKLESHCHFLGDIPNNEIEKLYLAADIFVQPSYNEGFPRVVLEAMASGLALVSTDAGGTAQLLGPLQAARVTDRDNPEAFAKELVLLLQDATLRAQLGAENRQWVKRFDTPVIAEMYEKVLFE